MRLTSGKIRLSFADGIGTGLADGGPIIARLL
jgi:hypothetical protein